MGSAGHGSRVLGCMSFAHMRVTTHRKPLLGPPDFSFGCRKSRQTSPPKDRVTRVLGSKHLGSAGNQVLSTTRVNPPVEWAGTRVAGVVWFRRRRPTDRVLTQVSPLLCLTLSVSVYSLSTSLDLTLSGPMGSAGLHGKMGENGRKRKMKER